MAPASRGAAWKHHNDASGGSHEPHPASRSLLRGGRGRHHHRRTRGHPGRSPTRSRRADSHPVLLLRELPAQPHRHPARPLRQPHRSRRCRSCIHSRALGGRRLTPLDLDGEHRHAGCSRARRDAQTEHPAGSDLEEGIATTTTNETTVRPPSASAWSRCSSAAGRSSPPSSTRTASSAASSDGSPASSCRGERLRLRRSWGARRGRVRTAGGRVPRVPS